MNSFKHRLQNLRSFLLFRDTIHFPPMRIRDDLKAIHITNPKTGGSSIRELMMDGGVMQSTHHPTGPQRAYYSFMFVRNPFDRLVSCFADKYSYGRNPEWIRTKYLMLAMIYGLNQDNSFDQFARKIARIPDRLADRHFKSQHWIYRANLRVLDKVDFVGRFENFETDFGIVREHVPLGPVGHENKSKHSDWRDYYSEELAGIVYERYQKDFDTWYPTAYDELVGELRQRQSVASVVKTK